MKQIAPIPITDRLAALAEMVRLRLCRLLEREELGVGELARVLQIPQSTASRHLKVLSAAGWVAKRAEGTATLYRLTLDDLPDDARALWITVRDRMGDSAELREDARRLESVLADRRTDSKAFFGRVAGEWDDIRSELFGSGVTAPALLGLLSPEWTVADLGCGTGNASELLAPFVREIIAIDASPTMLDAARKRLARFDNIRFEEGALEALPVEGASLDAAVCLLVLHHLDEPVRALAEMARVLKPGGRLLLVDMLEHDRDDYRRTMGHKRLGFSEQFITDAMRDAGLVAPRAVPLEARADAKGPSLFAATASKPAR